MDSLHTAGIRFAEALQAGPPWLEKFWISVTSLADPKCIFTVCFPLAYFLDRKVGVSVLWIGLVSEWLNVVLKWFLFGERPFWWVHESGLAGKQLVVLRQFPVSCETGPGSPSGHCMVTGAALWPLVTALTALASRHSRSLVVKMSPFGAYVLLLLAVGLSRIFVLAHFPHQVVGGILTGAVLGWRLQSCTLATCTLGFFVATGLALLLSSLALHSLLIATGIDIDWSIRLATKWCSNPSWLRLDTRPFASISRDTGSALGLGLAASFSLPQGARLDPWQRLASALLALVAIQVLHWFLQPTDVTLWYSTNFFKYAIGPWLVTFLLPQLVLSLTPPRMSPHTN
ncbi:PREDICTED: glucose-6-phosphatase 3 [Calidris pugnax]|uniref:glucose-6-phosphatase 3 n=1 Tax=Calidris pugnax TaxID=198806 RepID=UPI00071D69F7|nr:PREDICTED: glucose-6-phosphatase 3 [Calidris pugnax]XP_014814458.1 PREDICTED: glucose-6-phosphatase 3 [Calidris pugnax]